MSYDLCRVCGDAMPATSEGEYREATVPIDPEWKEIRKTHSFEVWICNGCLE